MVWSGTPGGRHHYDSATTTSVSRCDLMMWKNFTHSLFWGVAYTRHRPPHAQRTFGRKYSSITTLFDRSGDVSIVDKSRLHVNLQATADTRPLECPTMRRVGVAYAQLRHNL